MPRIPEEDAKAYAPYLLVLEYTEDQSGMHYYLQYGCWNFRNLSQILYRIRTGSALSPGYTARRVYLAYNAVQLPMPVLGIPGSAQ